MTSRMSVLTLVVTLGCVITIVAGDKAADAQKTAENFPQNAQKFAENEDGAKWCPAPVVGTECPSSSIFHYYDCCGKLNGDCCVHLQVWLVVLLVIIGIALVLSFVFGVLRCILCPRRR